MDSLTDTGAHTGIASTGNWMAADHPRRATHTCVGSAQLGGNVRSDSA